jgi:hypothetical protein
MAVVIASSEANGELFTASLWDVGRAAWDAFVNRRDMSSVLVSYVNQAVIAAEEAQPEGARIELSITGWTNPITGTDYSYQVADWINNQWLTGNVIGAGGEPITPWDEYPGQVAWSYGNMVVLRWTKLMPQVIVFLGLLAAVIWGVLLLADVLGRLSPWTMTSEVKKPSWWDKLSFGEKALVVGGVTVTALFSIWFLSARSIAEAGAGRQTIVIER